MKYESEQKLAFQRSGEIELYVFSILKLSEYEELYIIIQILYIICWMV